MSTHLFSKYMRNILTLPTVQNQSNCWQSEKLLPKLRGLCIVVLDADTI